MFKQRSSMTLHWWCIPINCVSGQSPANTHIAPSKGWRSNAETGERLMSCLIMCIYRYVFKYNNTNLLTRCPSAEEWRDETRTCLFVCCGPNLTLRGYPPGDVSVNNLYYNIYFLYVSDFLKSTNKQIKS